jgi:mono/diheme cytochrome c family protein
MTRTPAGLALAVLAGFALAACGPQGGGRQEISFKNQLQPVVNKHCAECHTGGGPGAEKSGFAVDSYQSLLKGTKYGPVVVPGSSVSSSLYRLVAGKVDPSIRMPHGKEKLSAAEIVLIEQWIDQGAKDN